MPYHQRKIKTKDGSFTLRIEGLKETYHSRHGAVTESKFVYIDTGFNFWKQNNSDRPCRILELGYGTGLVAYMSFLEASNCQQQIDYTSLEAYPLTQTQLQELNYDSFFEENSVSLSFRDFSDVDWEQRLLLTDYFKLTKNKIHFEDYQSSQHFDVIYYDAFGAHAQPELWESQWMKKCFELLHPGGIWVSYCAIGSVRRGLAAAGFEVFRLAGPPGKREMLRALKP